jgi:hypothetical protein
MCGDGQWYIILFRSYPLEMARTRMAVGNAQGNFVNAIVGVARTEGLPALFKVSAASVEVCWSRWNFRRAAGPLLC